MRCALSRKKEEDGGRRREEVLERAENKGLQGYYTQLELWGPLFGCVTGFSVVGGPPEFTYMFT
jgi:hypothetical protein